MAIYCRSLEAETGNISSSRLKPLPSPSPPPTHVQNDHHHSGQGSASMLPVRHAKSTLKKKECSFLLDSEAERNNKIDFGD